ncbi:neurogenic locus notch homolog protein 1-like [Polypterus senegalus]|uniref:neurogenic locus notch homolog protein 1-like n=1 Tax=Polypterus senegalus TaxID=55291 RepID=UPI001964765B|nr:neurogenic locus notch homolog protein 1-like [Polypterus senegalus]
MSFLPRVLCLLLLQFLVPTAQGVRCDKNCLNGGQCVLNTNIATCQCRPEYIGEFCQHPNPCSAGPSPCANSGTCVPSYPNAASPSNFTCVCAPGWTGSLCSINIHQSECPFPSPCHQGATCINKMGQFTCLCPPEKTGLRCDIDNACLSSPCHEDASCNINLVTGEAVCICRSGFTGADCRMDLDECNMGLGPCEHGGSCENTIGSFVCRCPPSHTGPRCDRYLNMCESRPCQNGGNCLDLMGKYICNCQPGFTGRQCETKDLCVSNPCVFGTCVVKLSEVSCQCQVGYTGQLCNISIDPCHSLPCANAGLCKDLGNQKYECACQPGTSGPQCEIIIDSCDSHPCDNGGSCVSRVGGFECSCLEGYSGTQCEEQLNQCKLNPCQNSGQCSLVKGVRKCTCPEGYSGDSCEDVQELDACSSFPCKHGGTCRLDGNAGYLCECSTGYGGTNCEETRPQCSASSCLNGGQCYPTLTAVTCQCPPAFTGERCQFEVTPCMSSPCLNMGTCINTPEGSYICQCVPGYIGSHCQTHVSICGGIQCKNGGHCVNYNGTLYCECPSDWGGAECNIIREGCDWVAKQKGLNRDTVCQNGGLCIDTVMSHYCQCPEGYQGSYCEERIDPCLKKPCYNDGVCTSLGGLRYTCKCPRGFTDTDCSIDIDECSSHPCMNGGTCLNLIDHFRCNCPNGTQGSYCEVNHDDCLPQAEPLCYHGGSCVDKVGGYECVCPAGYVGLRCEGDINECLSNPCHKPGTRQCVPGNNQYQCSCNPGYTGYHCEIQIDFCSSAPCQNGGVCKVTPAMPFGFTCLCAEGYSGPTCKDVSLEDPPTSCQFNSCLNGGTCLSLGAPSKPHPLVRCLCAPMYTGTRCRTRLMGPAQRSHEDQSHHKTNSSNAQRNSGDPWMMCPQAKVCQKKFRDGTCDHECSSLECLLDGFDCHPNEGLCESKYHHYCQDHYSNGKCEQGCRKANCGWDGVDCFSEVFPYSADGMLLLVVPIPVQDIRDRNISFLWALATVLRTSIILHGLHPFDLHRDLNSLTQSDLNNTDEFPVTPKSTLLPKNYAAGSLALLEIDNRPCSQNSHFCFPTANLVARFLMAVNSQRGSQVPVLPFPVSAARGINWHYNRQGGPQVSNNKKDTSTQGSEMPWILIGVALASGFVVLVAMIALGVKVVALCRKKQQKEKDKEQTRCKHRSKKQGKHCRRQRREPLGEDAIGMKPLRRQPNCGDDTDVTQSSMDESSITATFNDEEDFSSIRDHRPLQHKNYSAKQSRPQSPVKSCNTEIKESKKLGEPPKATNNLTKRSNVKLNESADRGSLHAAISSGSVPLCLTLLQKGVPDLNAEGPDGATPLILAVRLCMNDVVSQLLSAGAEVNAADHRGRTALHWASAVNNLPAARYLVGKAAVIDLQDSKGETALFLATREGSYDTAKFLLQKGANQELPNYYGWRPRHVAQERSHHDILKLLLVASAGHVLSTKGSTNNNKNRKDPRYGVYGGPGPWREGSTPYMPPQLVHMSHHYPDDFNEMENGRPYNIYGRSASFSGVAGYRQNSISHGMRGQSRDNRVTLRGGRISPHQWHYQYNQSMMAMVTPQIHTKSTHSIDTVQEVTSEAEEEARNSPSAARHEKQELSQTTTARSLQPSQVPIHPVERQRSFSCSQHMLRHYNISPVPAIQQPAPFGISTSTPLKSNVKEKTAPPSELPKQREKSSGLQNNDNISSLNNVSEGGVSVK